MYSCPLLTSEQIIKSNFIDDYIYGAELKGGAAISFQSPVKPEMHIIFLILRGKIILKTDESEDALQAAVLLNITPSTDVREIIYSPDFYGIITAVSGELILDIFRNRNPFPPSFVYRLKGTMSSPQLSARQKKIISSDMKNLIGALGNKEHHYAQELNYAHFYILLTDIADLMWHNFGQGDPDHSIKMTRADALMKQFFELAEANAVSEGKTEFYADALCISKQYLSFIIKKKVKVSVGTLLSRMRYEHACILLKDPSMTIQQIADRMRFADQSSFGKFFKRNSGGSSPQQYRNHLMNNLLTQRNSISD